MTVHICPSCKGNGLLHGVEGWKCFTCNGFGIIRDEDDYVSPEEQKRNDAMERGDELRDRAKDERS